jgi:PAS domain S-box-containing protein
MNRRRIDLQLEKTMGEKLRILLLEDVPEDAALVERQLHSDGIEFSSRLVETREDFIKELQDFKPDLIIADYSLPSFTGMEAIQLVRERTPATPIIVCTGSISEEIAVECIKAGAADYVIKEHIIRLGTAVKGALEKKAAFEEKVRAEKELREEHQYVRNLIDSSLDIIIAVDMRRKITEFNPAAEAAFGYHREEVIGKHVNLIYAKPKEGLAIHKKTVMNGQNVQEIMNRRKNGELFPALLSTSVLQDSGGELVGVMGVSRDITQEKQDEELLRFQADILSSVQDSVIVTDRERRIIYWNAGATQLYGYASDEMIGQTTAILYPEQDHGQIGKELDRLKIGEELSGAWKGRRKDGSAIWVATRTTLARDAAANPLGYISVSRDITRRKRAEEKLQLSDQILSRIENLVIVTDERSRVIFTGPSIMRMLGYSIDEVMGDGWFDLTWEDETEREREKTYIIAAIQGEVQFRTEPNERQIYDKDGKPHWILWQDAKGPGDTLVGIGHDITEYKRLESQIIHSEKMRAVGELSAGVAHEINSPIQYITSNIQFLTNAIPKIIEAAKLSSSDSESNEKHSSEDIKYFTEEIPQALEQSSEGLARISQIISALRTFSHPGDEAMSSVNINDAVEKTIAMTQNEWKYVAQMKTELDHKLPQIQGNAGNLHQTLLNIVINAIHALEDSGEQQSDPDKFGQITITTKRIADDILIEIADTGPGIPPDIQSRIFDPFFTTKEIGRGTGQGLSLAHAIIVEGHGGTISFETEEGKGTTFHITLPITGKQFN